MQMEAELVQAIPAMADEYDYSRRERAADCTLSGILSLKCVLSEFMWIHQSLCRATRIELTRMPGGR